MDERFADAEVPVDMRDGAAGTAHAAWLRRGKCAP